MPMRPDGQSTGAPMTPGPRRRPTCMLGGVGVVLVLVALLCALTVGYLAPTVRYEYAHDIPNPVWGLFNKSFSYTPATAATLNPALLASRPDTLVLRFISDYIQVAGTYPCAQDLASYDQAQDPILQQEAHTCPVKRPVVSTTINRVYVGIFGPEGGIPGANVTFTVRYADGSQWTSVLYLDAYRTSGYYLGYLHLTCWGSTETLRLYPAVVSRIPSGAAWPDNSPNAQSVIHCQS